MRIAVMAAGAVGGYFGGRLAAAGHDVAFIARGIHRYAIRWDGLKIESALGDLHLRMSTQVGPVEVAAPSPRHSGHDCPWRVKRAIPNLMGWDHRSNG
jgi:ketopantoate reductase